LLDRVNGVLDTVETRRRRRCEWTIITLQVRRAVQHREASGRRVFAVSFYLVVQQIRDKSQQVELEQWTRQTNEEVTVR